MSKIILLASVATAAAAAVTVVGVVRNASTGSSDVGIVNVVAPVSPRQSPALQAAAMAAASAANNGQCRTGSTYYPWGQLAARTWTPRRTAALQKPDSDIGAAYGAPFSARLVIAYGDDIGVSRRTAIFEMADGCRRQFRVNSFSDADIAAINTQVDSHPFPSDPAAYRRQLIAGVTTQERLNNDQLRSYTTQHFAFWYGTKTGSQSYRWARDHNTDIATQLQKIGSFFERTWQINRHVLNAPMPYADSTDKLKIDIFICGTGLPWYGQDDEVNSACGASASDSMQAPIEDILPGSDTATHEFGHVLQFYSGGFRERSGPMWEVGAEWNGFIMNPTWGGAAYTYFSNLENGPLFSLYRYGAFPFVTYLREKDGTRNLYWRSWRENLRNANGESQEDFVEALVRLGRTSGAYPQGYRSFADDMGWYGARLAAMDFVNQRPLLDAFRGEGGKSHVSHMYTPLARLATGTDPSIFAPPSQRSLMQFGTHLVPLTATNGMVSVTLTGGTQANSASWRFALVAVRENDVPYYSSLGVADGTGSGTVSIAPPAGTKLYLAVTATPYKYESLPWQPAGPAVGTKFPYRVRIAGATPMTGSALICNPSSIANWNMNYNTNGNLEGGRQC